MCRGNYHLTVATTSEVPTECDVRQFPGQENKNGGKKPDPKM